MSEFLRRWRTRVALVAVCILAPAGASAQNITGTITGTVADPQGHVVPGATVTVLNESTGEPRATVTDARGAFEVTTLPPGTYTVRIELASFRTIERKRVVLSAAERLSIGTLALELGNVGETVVVEAVGSRVNVAETQHSGVITSKQIEQIQVKGRDVTSLLRLLPGVRYEDTVDSLGESFGTLIPHVGGKRRDWNTVMVDGVLGNEIGQANRLSQQINLDSIAEIKVLINNYRAEYGRTGGAQVHIVSKSGSSTYNGGLYYYGRHEKLNANSFFNNRSHVDKARYRFNTYGANLGGPVPRFNGSEKKLLFFYSFEAPITERPGPLRRWTMPTEAERRGDFSQTLDSQGRLIFIRDPQATGACNAVTGGPACFPGNVIPADRINKNGQALLSVLPKPTLFDRSFTNGQFNHQTQEVAENPKLNQIVRLDWRPSSNDTFYMTFKDWYSDQRGSEVTAGPNKWGWFNTHYLNTDRGVSLNYTKILRSNVVNEAAFGMRRQTEEFHPVSEEDWNRARRSTYGYALGQFHPELNPEGILPKVTFNVPSSPNFTFDNRLGQKGQGWLASFSDNFTWTLSRHTLKTGLYVERLNNTEGKGGVGAGPWAGQFNFSVDTNNPNETNYSYANALLGVYRDYTEIDAYPEVQARRLLSEWYAQDTWKAHQRVTVDYGLRFLWYQPWYSKLPSAVFVPERYDPLRAPRLYEPARINNTNVALDPVTGEQKPNVFVGAFVPGTGNPSNGMVLSTEAGYPRGFRANQGIHVQPRAGVAWDILGDARTALHASAGMYHNPHITARSMDSAASNPPSVNTPTLFYGTMDTLLASAAAFSNRPSNVFGLERDAKTPEAYNWSIGVQREIGWGTVVDVTYVGSMEKHLEVVANVNVVPDGARFLDLHPENANPQSPTTAKAAEFLRPYRGYQNISIRSHYGTSDYDALQLQINRRYIHGVQFAVAYTYGKTRGVSDEDEGNVSIVRPLDAWHYAPYSTSQLHNLVINYTWDLPRASRLLNAGIVRAVFDNWQLSGENAFVSGDWAGITFSTSDNFDFTGGDGGSGGDVNGVRVVRPNIIGDVAGGSNRNPDPDSTNTGSWINWDAVARPAGRGDYGNAPRNVMQLPRIVNWNLSLFKNVPLGGKKRLQFRWEMYNVLNHTQWSGISTNATFNPAGQQTNASFGKATSARNPRIMQGSLRFAF
jgi:carboxypeptidase family protein/TonB-dependent receptor-like protein